MAAAVIISPVLFMLLLGFVSRKMGWISQEQKNGVSSFIFTIIFPVLVFHLMFTATFDMSSIFVFVYVMVAFFLAILVGKALSSFTGKKYKDFSPFLMATCEGGGVAIPLYLSIVGRSSSTIIYDLAGVLTCFIVIPIFMTKILAASNISGEEKKSSLLKDIFTNSFVLSALIGLVLSVLGVYRWLMTTPAGALYTAISDVALAPITACIVFGLGYELNLDGSSFKSVVKLILLRVVFYALVIGGFFIFFPQLMADKVYLIGALIYFMCPPGFGTAAVLDPLCKDSDDFGFKSGFVSLFVIVTLIVYTCVVLFVA